ncbi:LysR family transcriptional regulator [Aestuariirhabdus litorea]|uniref:LysR family transcriptional regulator n=1 Tax=Aestuariirhabdus litorea TaxID=2528527 RepID=A0A3P3VPZ7_9GAMM|nr:LysR family transcriptional regulator [Aestuariirhabdus litorea]RRJ84805.1 LysR family transcriptional regulator [Aestuariirhabdus litorea]RWW98029.1 LysR family transcriptional regulator [Endozoicomonadaceae bacterium GTF-13]
MRATLHQLRVFHKVASLMSYTAAGNEMGMTQPAVSIQLKQLEDNIGLPLLDKVGKQVSLTSPGEELYRFCEDLFARFDNIDMTLSAMKGGLEGEFRLAAVTSAMYFTPHLLGAFHKLYPKVKLRLDVVNREQIIRRIKENRDDMVIMGLVPDMIPLNRYPFVDNPIVFIAHPDHPLAGQQAIPLKTLEEHDVIYREVGSGTRKAVEDFLAEKGVEVQPSMLLGSSETIKQAVMAELGISAVSRHSVTLELATACLVELDVADFPLYRSWHLVHHQNKQLTPIAQAFIDFVLSPTHDIEALCDRFLKTHYVERSRRVGQLP